MQRALRQLSRLAGLGVLTFACAFPIVGAATAGSERLAVVGYRSEAALRRGAAATDARIVRRIPALHVAVLRTTPAAARLLDGLRGIRYSETPVLRQELVDPAIAPAPVLGGAYEWQYAATRENLVPASVMRAASAITVAVVDTGADVSAPDIGAKSPTTWSVRSGSSDVTDYHGHGTFVSSLAAGSSTNGQGVAGFGGDARLLVVQAASPDGTMTDVDEAAAIVYAVDHGARIINMSFGGPFTSITEESAIAYAAAHGVLLVAAAGNSGDSGDAPSYPAALLQPLDSDGHGGIGLAVGASTLTGARASFSNYGSYLSLAAPGENVFGALSSSADSSHWPRQPLPGSAAGLYGYGSGTSFATPEVAGAAALVWAADPSLSAAGVADMLEQSASGHGTWNEDMGYGVLDVAAAVARAQGRPVATPGAARASARLALRSRLGGRRLRLWAVLTPATHGAARFGRTIALESFDGRSWREVAVGATNRAGVARWTLALRAGSYRIRARFGGADDLAPATSRLVTVRAR
jgi:subtilisin family serine protease